MTNHDPRGPIIEVNGLRKTYPGNVEAVKGIDFEVAPGEVFGLLGPNGAGKSTTIGMLTTAIAPTGGTARLAGFDVQTDPLAARGVSSVVFQNAVVDRPLTGRRNLELHARLWRRRAGGRRGRASPSRWPRSASARSPTGRSAPTAAASGAGSRSPGRSCPARGCSSWTSRRSASTRASATSSSTSSAGCGRDPR